MRVNEEEGGPSTRGAVLRLVAAAALLASSLVFATVTFARSEGTHHWLFCGSGHLARLAELASGQPAWPHAHNADVLRVLNVPDVLEVSAAMAEGNVSFDTSGCDPSCEAHGVCLSGQCICRPYFSGPSCEDSSLLLPSRFPPLSAAPRLAIPRRERPSRDALTGPGRRLKIAFIADFPMSPDRYVEENECALAHTHARTHTSTHARFTPLPFPFPFPFLPFPFPFLPFPFLFFLSLPFPFLSFLFLSIPFTTPVQQQ